MLITTVSISQHEVIEIGLQKINMRRLGKFVALSGKNGAGKSRILQTITSNFDHIKKIRRTNYQFGKVSNFPSKDKFRFALIQAT